MRRYGLWLALGLVALLAVIAGILTGESARQNAPPVIPAIPVFELELTDLQFKRQNLGQWRGKVLVVNYWATWCPPCREEIPGFSRLHIKYRDKGVQFVGISNDPAAKVTEFQAETPVSYPLLIGDLGVMQSSAGLGNQRQGLPFTAVFDRQGRLAVTKLGRLSEAELERELVRLLSDRLQSRLPD